MSLDEQRSVAGGGAIRVAIIEDQPDVREGLELLIGQTPGFACTGGYRTMEAALVGIARRPPDVALVDLGLPEMSGTEGIRILKERHPSVETLVLTVYDDDRRIFDALCAGAVGYLLKNTPPARILDSLRETTTGGAPMSPEIARRVIRVFRQVRPPARADHDLTPHEVRILRLLVDGHNYKTAAERLDVSVNTISFHMKRIYAKLQVHSKSEAVAKALRSGLVS